MNKKRNPLEIMYDILDTINKKRGPANPTHILYKSNLSYKMLKDYINELLEKDFIKEEGDKKRVYSLTKKGKEYLSNYHIMTNFLDRFGL